MEGHEFKESFVFLMGMICLLSASISLIFALVIFTLRHNAGLLQKQSWAAPFAATFFVLAEIYFLRFCNVLIEKYLPGADWLILTRTLELIVFTSSGVTNYLLFLSGFRLLPPGVDRPSFLPVRNLMKGRAHVRHAALFCLCLAGAIQLFDKWNLGPRWLQVVTNVPDAVLSMFVLLFMGYVLHTSISSRSKGLMAWFASASAVTYAGLYLLYGLGIITYLVEHGLQGPMAANASPVADLLTFVLSLLLKFGLFFPGFSLMLLASGPFEVIERFYENFTRQEEEYVGSRGIVKSIREELEVEKVCLDIKLPGAEEQEVAHYSYPSTTNGHNSQEPQRHSYDERTDLGRVMASGETYIRNNGSNPYSFMRKRTELTVPLIFHNAVIASLKADLGYRPFNETYLSDLKRITTMVSPAVQGYREMAALNKLSRDLARLQIGIEVYEMERDLDAVTKILQNVISPSASGIAIDIGFDLYRSRYPQAGPLAELVKGQLGRALNEEDVQDGCENYRWLRKELKIPSGVAGEQMAEQVLGKFIFGIEKQGERRQQATIGTNQIFRRALADLTTNTLLEFIRGYLNQLTDQLGVELSSLNEEKPEKWIKVVEQKAQKARLLWAAARFEDDDELFGESEMNPEIVALIKGLESKETQEQWQIKCGGLRLCALEQPVGGTHHIIRKVLAQSKAVLWLGVARPDFGPELDYVSPWKYFLDHFCAIADSALYRIRMKIQRRLQDIYVESLRILSAANIATGNVKHNLVNRVGPLAASLETLEIAVSDESIQCDETIKNLIKPLRPICEQLKNDIGLLRDALNQDKSLDCSLDDAIAKVCDPLEETYKKLDIRIVKPAQEGVRIGVPMYAATVVLETVLDNAKDAIVESRNGRTGGEVKEGLIEIKVVANPDVDVVICDITDNGPGVPPELQDKLFNEPVAGTKLHSNGLGTFLSALTLRGYNGDILLKRPSPGATIRLKFPRPPRKSVS